MKRYFLELDNIKTGKHYYKAKFNGLSFNAINTIKPNKCEEINYNKLSDIDKLEQTKKLYLKFLDDHNKKMEGPSYQKLDRKLSEEEKKEIKIKQQEFEREYINQMIVLTEYWNKQKDTVLIEDKEIIYQIDPQRRGNWVNGEYYALGYDLEKDDESKLYNGEIGELKKKCEEAELVCYSLYTNFNLKYIQLSSYRPLMFDKNMKMKNDSSKMGYIVHPNPVDNKNKFRSTLLYVELEDGRDEVIYFDRYSKENTEFDSTGFGTFYWINAFGRFSPTRLKQEDWPFRRIEPLVAIKGTDDNIAKYGANFITEDQMTYLITQIIKFAPFKKEQ